MFPDLPPNDTAHWAQWRVDVAGIEAGPQLALALATRPNGPQSKPPDAAPDQHDPNPYADTVERRCADVLLDSLQHRQRLLSHLQAEQIADLSALAHDYPGVHEFLSNEVGLALRIAETTAQFHIDNACRLTDDLPQTWAALHRGDITEPQARAIADSVAGTSAEVTANVEADALAKAPSLNPGELRQRCRRRVLRLDADAARRRHTAAVADRTVTTWALPDGMAALRMIASAPDVAIAYTAVAELGRQAKTPGDGRSAANRRVDAFVDLCRSMLVGEQQDVSSMASPGRTTASGVPAAPAPPGGGTPRQTTVPHTVTFPMAPVATASRPTPSHTGTSTIVMPTNGSGCPCGSSSSDTPKDLLAGLRGPTPAPAAHRPTQARRSSSRRRPAVVYVTVPFTSLIGGEEPGHLVGIGPISADQARLIAGDATLRRILTDPITGQLLDVGRTRYRPPSHLAEHVRLRDARCVTPGCLRSPMDCELDHTIPYRPGDEHGGQTSADNLTLHCKHHHRAKDGGGCHLRREADGTYLWTTALGRSYRSVPADTVELVDPATLLATGTATAHTDADADADEPPF